LLFRTRRTDREEHLRINLLVGIFVERASVEGGDLHGVGLLTMTALQEGVWMTTKYRLLLPLRRAMQQKSDGCLKRPTLGVVILGRICLNAESKTGQADL
jgi:hypothetical protein